MLLPTSWWARNTHFFKMGTSSYLAFTPEALRLLVLYHIHTGFHIFIVLMNTWKQRRLAEQQVHFLMVKAFLILSAALSPLHARTCMGPSPSYTYLCCGIDVFPPKNSVIQCYGSVVIDQLQNLQVSHASSMQDCPPLRLVEVGGNSDHRILDGLFWKRWWKKFFHQTSHMQRQHNGVMVAKTENASWRHLHNSIPKQHQQLASLEIAPFPV